MRASTGGYPNSVQLDFNSPVDEEGAPIFGYQVWCRLVDLLLFSQSWKEIGAYEGHIISEVGYSRRILVSNILPNNSYSFKVSAYNIIGHAALSHSSNAVIISVELGSNYTQSSTYTLYGRGHTIFQSTGLNNINASGRARLTLNVANQTLVIDSLTRLHKKNPREGTNLERSLDFNYSRIRSMGSWPSRIGSVTINGWVSDFSSFLFAVAAECVWMYPPLVSSGQRGILNPEELYGSIAIVLGGERYLRLPNV